MSKVIWIDTETTGLDPKIHGLREVGFLIEIDGLIVEEGHLHINTLTYKNERYISKYVSENFGVYEVSLAFNESSQEQLVKFERIMNKYVNINDKSKFQMAGFNVSFDYEFIKEWFSDTDGLMRGFNAYFGYQKLDVLELVRHLKYLNLFKTKNNKLETLCNHFDVDINAHQALSDIQATKILHQVLVEDFIKRGDKDESNT